MQQQNHAKVVDSDGLIQAPPLGTSLKARVVRWTSVVVFCVVVFGTPIVDLVAPAPAIKLVGTERSQDIRLRQAARPWDGSLFRLLEHDLRVRSRIRQWATDRYGWFLYRWLGHVQSDLVAGRSGSLFLPSRVEVAADLETDFIAGRAAASMAAIHRRIAALGLNLIVVPIPRKSALLADELPANVAAREEADVDILDKLADKGVPYVDLWSAFAARTEDPPYHLLGSHWSDEAQLVAARAVAEASGRMVDSDHRGTTVAISEPRTQGVDTDLLRYGGMENHHGLPKEAARRSVAVRGAKDLRASEPGPVVVVGSSFTDRRRFTDLLSHFIDEPVYNGAQAGRFPGQTLARFLRNPFWKGHTEVLVFETPLHHLIQDPVVRLVAPTFALPPPKPLLRYFDVDWPTAGEPFEIGPGRSKWRRLATVTDGRVAHTGDGVVGVRVAGNTDRDVLLRLASDGGEQVIVQWRAGVREIVVPLIAAKPAAGAVHLSISPSPAETGDTEVVIDGIAVVSEVHPEPRFDLRVHQPVADAGGWRAIVDVPGGAVSSTALLELGLGVKGEFPGELAIEVRAIGEDEPLWAEWKSLKRGTLVVLSLSRFAGRALERIELSGPGEPPRELLHRAVLRAGGAGPPNPR